MVNKIKYKESLKRAVRKNLKNHNHNSTPSNITRQGDVLRIGKQFGKPPKDVMKEYVKVYNLIKNEVKKPISKSKKVKSVPKSKKVKPNLSTNKELKSAVARANKLMNRNMSLKDKKLLKLVINRFEKGDDSKKMFTIKGKYTPHRLKLHNDIINKILKQDKVTKKPDLYIFGGVGGSGKGTHLGRLVKEKAVTLNNDDIKFELAKVTPSGSSRFFLINASLLHREAQDVEQKALERLLRTKKDVILDRTIGNYDKNLKLVKKFISKGYEITTFGTSLKPHIAVSRSTKRFLRGKEGRYVPIKKIAKVGNKINKNTLRMAKQPFNKKALIVNTYRRKPKVIYEKK